MHTSDFVFLQFTTKKEHFILSDEIIVIIQPSRKSFVPSIWKRRGPSSYEFGCRRQKLTKRYSSKRLQTLSFFCVSDAAFLYENVISGSSGGGKTDIDWADKEATAVMFRRHNRFWQVESVWNKCLNWQQAFKGCCYQHSIRCRASQIPLIQIQSTKNMKPLVL